MYHCIRQDYQTKDNIIFFSTPCLFEAQQAIEQNAYGFVFSKVGDQALNHRVWSTHSNKKPAIKGEFAREVPVCLYECSDKHASHHITDKYFITRNPTKDGLFKLNVFACVSSGSWVSNPECVKLFSVDIARQVQTADVTFYEEENDDEEISELKAKHAGILLPALKEYFATKEAQAKAKLEAESRSSQ